MINDGKLAVIMGMEVSEPFGCRLMQPGDVPHVHRSRARRRDRRALRPRRAPARADQQVRQRPHRRRRRRRHHRDDHQPRQLRLGGHLLGPRALRRPRSTTTTRPTALEHNDDEVIANGLDAFAAARDHAPVYGPPPHCNQRGLTDLGERAIRRIVDKGMLFDPDHMSVIARNEALDMVEAREYPRRHDLAQLEHANALRRDLRPRRPDRPPDAGGSEGFVARVAPRQGHARASDDGQFFGIGWGADRTASAARAARAAPGSPNPVTYPFKSFDRPGATIDQPGLGQRSLRHQRRRRRPLWPLPGLGPRTCG